MATPGIPILKFPYVILTQIVCSSDPNALTFLSMCSQRMHNFIRCLHRKFIGFKLFIIANHDAPHVEIELENTHYVALSVMHIPASSGSKSVRIRGHTVPTIFIQEDHRLFTCWDDPAHGLKEITEYVANLFGVNVYGMELTQPYIWMIDWVQSRQAKSVEFIETKDEKWSAEEYGYVMSKSNAKILNFCVIPPKDFKHLGPFHKRYHFSIWNGFWVRMEHLLRMDCIYLFVADSLLESNHLNILLKHWIGGGFQRLRHLCLINRHDFLHDTVFHELESNVTIVEQERTYVIKPAGAGFSIPANTPDIKRHDGAVASVVLEGKALQLFCWPHYSN